MSKSKSSNVTLKRLTVLAVIVAVLASVAGGLYYMRSVRNEKAIAAQRPAAMTAMEQGDYEDARTRLAIYLRHHDDDVEALYAFSKVQLNVPTDGNGHVQQAMGTLRKVRELDPDHDDAAHDLLKIYTRIGFGTEALALADEMLAKTPDDLEALEGRVWAYARLGQPAEALEAAHHLASVHPERVQSYLRVLAMMERDDASHEDMLSYATQVAEETLEGAPGHLLLGAVHRIGGNDDQAREHYLAAAEEPPVDGDLLATLTTALDTLGESEAASQAVRRAVDSSDSVEPKRIHASRSLQLGDVATAEELLASVDSSSDEADSQLLALKAVLRTEQQSFDEVVTIGENLSKRPTTDAVAQAWAPVLKLQQRQAEGEGTDLQDVLEAVRKSRSILPRDPFLALLQGRSYAAMGEHEQAIDALRESASLATAAVSPLILMAEIHNRQGQPEEAVAAARTALNRSANNLEAAVHLTLGLAAHPKRPPAEALLSLVDSIQEHVPGEPRTLAMYLELLLETQQQARAEQVLRQTMEAEQPVDEALLARLSAVARSFDDALADELLAHSQEVHGLTPRLAFLRAGRVRAEQGDEAGLAVLDDARPDSEGTDRVQWQFYRTHYLEATGDDGAAAAWKELVELAPTNRDILRGALEAASTQNDRTFRYQVIEHLREATGESSTVWRMAMARWRLADAANPEKSAGEAALLLNQVVRTAPDNVDAHWLLANALGRLGNERGMIDHLREALQLRADAVDPALALAAVLQDRGEYAEAGRFLNRVMEQTLSAAQRRRAASLWLARGETDIAIALLQEAEQDRGEMFEDDLLLAQLYLQRNEAERSDALLQQILANPEQANQPRTLRFAADLYAWQGDAERAAETLAKLEQMEGIDEVARQLMLAGHYAAHGTAEQAAARFEAAVQANPEHVGAWRGYLLWTINRGDHERMAALLPRAVEHLPGYEPFQVLARGDDAVTAVRAPMLRPLVASVLTEQEGNRAVAGTLLSRVVAIHRGEDAGENLMPELERLADAHPRYLVLQNLAARMLVATGRHEQAIRIASRTSETFPNDSESLAITTAAMIADERWQQAISAANRWRERAPNEAASADSLIAEAHLNLDRATEALAVLEPYIETAKQDPQRHASMLALYARSLLQAGRAEEAGDLLLTRLGEAAALRGPVRRLAERLVNDAQLAEQWLSELEEATPEDAVDDRLANAIAWHRAGSRLNSDGFVDRCEAIVAELVKRDDASAMAFMLYGELAQTREDWPAAERAFDKVLEMTPENAVAKNNLAMALLEQDRQLLHALDLARAASEALPEQPIILDTLVRVLLKLGEYSEAVTVSERILEIDPQDLSRQIELIWALTQAGRLDEARDQLEQVRVNVADVEQLPEESRERLQEIERLLGEAAANRASNGF
ncbi:MAG: tetratricopeptide repeat protein [Phycisphaeraceae bacterium]